MSASFSDFYYSSQDGLKLHARVYGEPSANRWPVICLPGLTRNVRDFHELAVYLSTEAKTPRAVVSFDYRGRGQSEYARDWSEYDPIVEARDIVAGLTALNIEHGAFIGTSRGGLIMMVMAATRPGALACGILNDIGPAVEGAGLANIRSYLENAPVPKSWQDAIEIQRTIGAKTFTALGDEDWERAARSINRDENGKPVPDFDPALLKTVTTVDLNAPLPTFWPQFDGLGGIPLLGIRGENSMLLSADTFDAMQKRHPNMEAITVNGQGHAPFLETVGLPKKIAAFIDKAEKAAEH